MNTMGLFGSDFNIYAIDLMNFILIVHKLGMLADGGYALLFSRCADLVLALNMLIFLFNFIWWFNLYARPRA